MIAVTPSKPGSSEGSVTIRSENISGKDLPARTENLQPIFVWSDGNWQFADADRERPVLMEGYSYKLSLPVSGERTVEIRAGYRRDDRRRQGKHRLNRRRGSVGLPRA
ncbi:hypothetical protein GT003_31795 [Paenibacillus sacheonensis]|uniref:Uncharacterized protein n=1 Tax=Paenibacillus sacheonensis TaxID=742054 RepID=A0A7X5C285_9BACL|nr:hypothetical protein [Paenibacillus sacheonensis]NBC73546.1 hypothetical protein [Paenibacillus sacheonensis]